MSALEIVQSILNDEEADEKNLLHLLYQIILNSPKQTVDSSTRMNGAFQEKLKEVEEALRDPKLVGKKRDAELRKMNIFKNGESLESQRIIFQQTF